MFVYVYVFIETPPDVFWHPHRSVHNLKAFTPCLLFARQESYDHDDDSRFLQRSLHVMVARFDPNNYCCASVAYHFAEHSLKYFYSGIAGSRFVSCSHVCRCFPHLGAPLRLWCHIRLLWKHLFYCFFFSFDMCEVLTLHMVYAETLGTCLSGRFASM